MTRRKSIQTTTTYHPYTEPFPIPPPFCTTRSFSNVLKQGEGQGLVQSKIQLFKNDESTQAERESLNFFRECCLRDKQSEPQELVSDFSEWSPFFSSLTPHPFAPRGTQRTERSQAAYNCWRNWQQKKKKRTRERAKELVSYQ